MSEAQKEEAKHRANQIELMFEIMSVGSTPKITRTMHDTRLCHMSVRGEAWREIYAL